jgi:hypothetical protein
MRFELRGIHGEKAFAHGIPDVLRPILHLARASFLQNLRICVNSCLLDRNSFDPIVRVFMLTERILQRLART